MSLLRLRHIIISPVTLLRAAFDRELHDTRMFEVSMGNFCTTWGQRHGLAMGEVVRVVLPNRVIFIGNMNERALELIIR